jgi:hypothetical protein
MGADTRAPEGQGTRRARLEGTLARGTRRTRLRRPRESGLARVRLEHLLTAVGRHVLRLGEWCLETAPAKSRITPFAGRMAAAAASLDETSPAVSNVPKSRIA